jgi:hypothetical protein
MMIEKREKMKSIVITALVLVGWAFVASSGWTQNKVSQQTVAPGLAANKIFTIKGSISGMFSSHPQLCRVAHVREGPPGSPLSARPGTLAPAMKMRAPNSRAL